MKPPFKIAWEEVTPPKAKQWLAECNAGNRSLRSTTVDSFAGDMKRGTWSPSPQGIAFNTGGNLIDGQHRLAAIVRSGVAVWMLVFRDIPERLGETGARVKDAIDRGNQRSVADVLKLSHGYKVNATQVVATCAIIAQIALKTPERVKRPSVSTILQIAERYRKALEWVCENRPTNVGLRVTPVAGAVAFAYAASPRKAQDFYQRLASGVGLDHESPILVLRNHLIGDGALNSNRGGQRDRVRLAELTLHTIHCFIEQKPMPRVPREESRAGADWFRLRQPENVKFLQSLFPDLDTTEQRDAGSAALTAKDIQLTPAAEALIAGKSRIDYMRQRIKSGELE